MDKPPTFDETFLPPDVVAPPARADRIRVGAFEPRSLVAGPGERAVVWVTGCLRRCPGCMKPEWFAFDTGEFAPVSEIADRVLALHAERPLAGVTFSGGEPFEQALPLATLAAIVRRAGLNVLTYSGYRLAVLRADDRFIPLLNQSDWLIDGEYRRDLPGPFAWRGSANQTVYRQDDDGVHQPGIENQAPAVREVQVSLTASALRLSGFADLALQRDLQASLGRRGIRMTEQR